MKKMIPLVIFLIVLVAVCIAGCANFGTIVDPAGPTIEDYENNTGDTVGSDVSDTGSAYEGATDIVALDVPVTDAVGEIVTDTEGNWVTTREYYEIPVTTQTATTAQSGEVVPGTTGQAAQNNPSSQSGNETPTQNTSTPSAGSTEYDILRSGTFYMKGTMTSDSETLPLEAAITPNTVYMTSSMDGIDVGILVDANKKVYMMINQKKVYLELSDAVMKYMELDPDDLISSDNLNFSNYKPLDQADKVNDVTLNGTAVKEYVFSAADGETRIYMNGNKLCRFASYTTSGKLISASDITLITSNVPADKTTPPKDYKGYSGITGLIGFMSQMTDLME